MIESVIGRVKNKFKMLKGIPKYAAKKESDIVLATCVAYNMSTVDNLGVLEVEDDIEPDDMFSPAR